VVYGVQFCDRQTETVGRLALALASAWVAEAQVAPAPEQPAEPVGELV
jgi:hypothetical protein